MISLHITSPVIILISPRSFNSQSHVICNCSHIIVPWFITGCFSNDCLSLLLPIQVRPKGTWRWRWRCTWQEWRMQMRDLTQGGICRCRWLKASTVGQRLGWPNYRMQRRDFTWDSRLGWPKLWGKDKPHRFLILVIIGTVVWVKWYTVLQQKYD